MKGEGIATAGLRCCSVIVDIVSCPVFSFTKETTADRQQNQEERRMEETESQP